MKLYKRILPLFLALMIAASAILLASCSSDKKDDAAASATPASDVSTASAAETAPVTASVPEETYACTFTFICVDKEGKEITKEIRTNEKFLRGALEKEGLIKGTDSEFGLMVSEVCGIVADYNADGAYWALYVGDEYATTGVDSTELVSGATYKFVYEVYVSADV